MRARGLDESRVDHRPAARTRLGPWRRVVCKRRSHAQVPPRHPMLGHVFESRPLPKGRSPETVHRSTSQRGPVRQEPRLHDLDHQERLIVASASRAIPFISFVKVLPYASARPPRLGFAVHQQEGNSTWTWVLDGCRERDRTCDFFHLREPLSACVPRVPPLRKNSVQARRNRRSRFRSLIPAAFDVDDRAHQRLPPVRRSSRARRGCTCPAKLSVLPRPVFRIAILRGLFSQTTTLDGMVRQRVDEHARMRRHDDLRPCGCLHEQFRNLRDDVRMQAELRLLQTRSTAEEWDATGSRAGSDTEVCRRTAATQESDAHRSPPERARRCRRLRGRKHRRFLRTVREAPPRVVAWLPP